MNYDRDNSFTVMTTMGIGGVLEEEFRKVSRVVFDYKSGYFRVSNRIQLYRFFKNEGFDTIVDMHGSMSGITLMLAKRAGIKTRISFYRSVDAGFSHTWYKNLYELVIKKLMTRSATKIFSNSRAALDKQHPGWENYPNKFKVIYNGLDMNKLSIKSFSEERKALGVPDNVFLIGHSGRVTRAKNHNMILRVAERLCKKYDDIVVLLMGNGTDTKLSKEVKDRGLEGRVRLMGNRRDVLDILTSLDLYYFPSFYEGQPNALIEAMASGVPIAASNASSIVETVPDYIRPHLVAPDDETANFELLERLYLDADFRNSQKCDIWAKKQFDAVIKFEDLKKEL